MREGYRKRKKICQLCTGKTLNYKDIDLLKKYINEKGKILPRRMTGTCSKHQRYITEQIKRARFMALLPFAR
ncbi:MAG: 30S ribosomal protein S18 [Bacilli bacterium]|jgi:small subunit ribosomal protein S18